MLSSRIKYLFISSNFDDMKKLKITLEEKHSTLRCDVALDYNSRVDLAQYDLLAVDIFSISDHPLEMLATLRYATYVSIVVFVPQVQVDSVGTQDILFARLYELGADMVLPLHLPEAAVGWFGAFYRRHVYFQHQEPIRHRSTMIFRDEMIIEPKHRRVIVRGKEVELTYKEFDLLYYLACNEDIVVTHDMIADRIWGSDSVINNSIFSAINRLRRKIEPDPRKPTYIKSVYGGGYRFKSYIDNSC